MTLSLNSQSQRRPNLLISDMTVFSFPKALSEIPKKAQMPGGRTAKDGSASVETPTLQIPLNIKTKMALASQSWAFVAKRRLPWLAKASRLRAGF